MEDERDEASGGRTDRAPRKEVQDSRAAVRLGDALRLTRIVLPAGREAVPSGNCPPRAWDIGGRKQNIRVSVDEMFTSSWGFLHSIPTSPAGEHSPAH